MKLNECPAKGEKLVKKKGIWLSVHALTLEADILHLEQIEHREARNPKTAL